MAGGDSSPPPDVGRGRTTAFQFPATPSRNALNLNTSTPDNTSTPKQVPETPPSPTARLRHKISTTLSVYNPVLELDNRGSVARDHLANERTYLAWLRTSLSLASIGVAITQLFRITSASSSRAKSFFTPSVTPTLPSQLEILSLDDLSGRYADLLALVMQQTIQLDSLAKHQEQAVLNISLKHPKVESRYRHLGKPIGLTFIVMGLLFLFLGSGRYFSVQSALTRNKFSPARRSVITASLAVAALSIAAFLAIIALQ